MENKRTAIAGGCRKSHISASLKSVANSTGARTLRAQTIREKAKIRLAREEGRLTEDEIARARLEPSAPSDSAKMTPDAALQTPSPLDPGHTS